VSPPQSSGASAPDKPSRSQRRSDARSAQADSPQASGPDRSFLWAMLGAVLIVVSFPPIGLLPLGMLAPWPLALGAIGARSGGRAFWRFCLVGVVVLCGSTWWLSETHVFNLAVVTVVEAPIFGLFGWIMHRVLRTGSLFPALPAIFTAHEMFRMSWPETGYAWALLGQALAASPILVQVADLGGVLAVTFVGACLGTGLYAWHSGRDGRRPALAVVAFGILYGVIRPATLGEPEPGPLLATIQPGFDQQLKDNGQASDVRWGRCYEQVEAIALESAERGEEPDLLIFPETMWPWLTLVDGRGPGRLPEGASAVDAQLRRDYGRHAPRIGQLGQLFPGGNVSLLLGAHSLALVTDAEANGVDEPQQVNTALLINPDGLRVDRYDKHILIPGGEMIPFRGYMPEAVRSWLDRMVRDLAGFLPDLAPGPGPRTLTMPGAGGYGVEALPFGVTICFENAYGDFNGKLVAAGARFLVNLSNEGWFGTSPEFDHMELQSILRVVETRRAMFRSTNTGISCLVRPDGRRPEGPDRCVVGGEDRGVAGTFTARVPLHDDWTLYVLWGDTVGWLCLGGTLLLLVRRRGSERAALAGDR